MPVSPAPKESMEGPVAMPVDADMAPTALAGMKCTQTPTSTPPVMINNIVLKGSIYFLSSKGPYLSRVYFSRKKMIISITAINANSRIIDVHIPLDILEKVSMNINRPKVSPVTGPPNRRVK